MSNYGFHQAMEAAGIEVATTKVGDRYVIEELLERGWTIGGEQSGHIIWTDFARHRRRPRRGAARDAGARRSRRSPTSRPIEKLPQRLENVPVPSREALDDATGALGGGRPRGRPPRGPRAGCSSGRPAPSRWSG